MRLEAEAQARPLLVTENLPEPQDREGPVECRDPNFIGWYSAGSSGLRRKRTSPFHLHGDSQGGKNSEKYWRAKPSDGEAPSARQKGRDHRSTAITGRRVGKRKPRGLHGTITSTREKPKQTE